MSNYQRSDVEFDSAGITCRAWHYVPEQPVVKPTPCIVMAHGLGGTRDAGLEPYAERFVAEGYQVLLFDYRYFGASDGEPRQLLQISKQLADWREAIRFARALPGVDAERIALWGSSFSGGHVTTLAAEDSRIAAFVAQGPMMDGQAAVFGLMGYAGIGHVLKMAAYGLADVTKSSLGLGPVTMPIMARPGGFAAMSSHDTWDGYGAIHPDNWKNVMTSRMALTLALYRPVTKADKIRCPGLIQACMKDTVAPAPAAVKVAQKMGDRATLKQYDVGHFDIYVGAAFEQGVADQIAFFKAKLLG